MVIEVTLGLLMAQTANISAHMLMENGTIIFSRFQNANKNLYQTLIKPGAARLFDGFSVILSCRLPYLP
jgi:hypothetical protein